MFNLDVRIDNQLRPQLRIGRELMLFPRTIIFGNYEYLVDLGWINDLNEDVPGGNINYKEEITWNAGVEFLLSKNFALMASYDNRFGPGGGLSILF